MFQKRWWIVFLNLMVSEVFSSDKMLIVSDEQQATVSQVLCEEDGRSPQRIASLQRAQQAITPILLRDVEWKNKHFIDLETLNFKEFVAFVEWFVGHNNPVTYSLSEVVSRVLAYLEEHPEAKIMMAWDVDDVLVRSPEAATNEEDFFESTPLHLEVGRLLQSLDDAGVDMILLTAGCFTIAKLQGVNIQMRMFKQILESVQDKGMALKTYLETLPAESKPDHVFFVDDQAWAHCQRGFKEKVASAGFVVTVLQHNEAHFFQDRNSEINYAHGVH